MEIASLTHTAVLLLQLKHFKGMSRNAASCMQVPLAVEGLQGRRKMLGFITRHAIPESLREDEVNL